MTGLTVDPDLGPITITVATRGEITDTGATYAEPVTRTVIADDGRREVRTSDGETTVSETTVYDTPDQAALYAVGSRVTVNGRAALVIATKLRSIGDPDVDHVEVALT